MRKSPLIGVSICAVVLLVLSSFTNVIGVQSTTSSSLKESPLFCIRTKRAINEESKDLFVSKYLGKTNTMNLLFPTQNKRMELLYTAINRIQAMDESSFERFIRSAVARLSKQEKLYEITPQQLITGFHQLKDNPPASVDYNIGSNNINITWSATPTLCWFPGCVLYLFFLLALHLLASIMGETFCP
jgi:hypothetical protein